MKNELKFTKGEWVEHPKAKGNIISKETGRIIASCNSYQSNMEDTFIENNANAQLISAAPDLLDALNLFIKVINRSEAALFHYGEAIEKAEVAIFKATKIK